MEGNSDRTYSLNDYQAAAMVTRLPSATLDYCQYNLCSEAGEVAGLIAKGIRDGRKFDYDQNMKKELGDVLWQVAAIAQDHGFTLQDIAEYNLYKLASRRLNGTLQGSGDDR